MNIQNGLLKSLPFFASLECNLLVTLVSKLRPLKVERGDVIYRKGDHANHSESSLLTPSVVLFIVEGRVDYYLEHLRMVYKTIMAGTYFGDYEVIHRERCKHTTRAKEDSRMLMLSKEAYRKVIDRDYPDVKRKMAYEAKQKYERIDKCLKVVCKANGTKDVGNRCGEEAAHEDQRGGHKRAHAQGPDQTLRQQERLHNGKPTRVGGDGRGLGQRKSQRRHSHTHRQGQCHPR